MERGGEETRYESGRLVSEVGEARTPGAAETKMGRRRRRLVEKVAHCPGRSNVQAM